MQDGSIIIGTIIVVPNSLQKHVLYIISFRAFWNDENKLLPQSFRYWKNFDKHIEHLFEEKSILTAKKTAKRIRTTRLGANK